MKEILGPKPPAESPKSLDTLSDPNTYAGGSQLERAFLTAFKSNNYPFPNQGYNTNIDVRREPDVYSDNVIVSYKRTETIKAADGTEIQANIFRTRKVPASHCTYTIADTEDQRKQHYVDNHLFEHIEVTIRHQEQSPEEKPTATVTLVPLVEEIRNMQLFALNKGWVLYIENNHENHEESHSEEKEITTETDGTITTTYFDPDLCTTTKRIENPDWGDTIITTYYDPYRNATVERIEKRFPESGDNNLPLAINRFMEKIQEQIPQ